MNSNVMQKIQALSSRYSTLLNGKVIQRMDEMKKDDNSHYLIYRVLGITDKEGELVDLYQNKGRFLYKYAGSFLEEAAFICFKDKFNHAKKHRIANTQGLRPKTFEIDCLVGSDAYEIKWRDATTDGDHITKEHTRVKEIQKAGYRPIRIMFYYPNREQAIKIQKTLETLYQGVNGVYVYGEDAWEYITQTTSIDLKGILLRIADSKRK